MTSNPSIKNYILGIDTGGTYTDGVLLDENTRQIVATTKTLTTKHDLSQCILKALDQLLPDDPSQIGLVSISTTLATNAIAEGKGRPVALFLLGYDPELVNKFKLDGHFATSSYHYFQGGHNLHGEEQTPLGVDAVLEQALTLQEDVEAFAVSGYFSPFNSDHEERCFEAISDKTGQPVVLGHQLSSKLNSIQRAATATLNASLLSLIQEFVLAMRSALDVRQISAPLMVVRGDGGLMNAATTKERPVETVHSGPAASAIGARFLSKQDKALVIDIGGTTTDIAIVDNGQVDVREEGTTVGIFNTAVRAANVRSIGLGGDSQISFDIENRLTVGPNRVTPICYLAYTFPSVAKQIRALPHREYKRLSPDHIEYWFLQREPKRSIRNDLGKEVVKMLRERPMPLPEILERMGLFHPLQFGGQALLQEEIIGRAALTPTDLLHLNGEYAPWDREAARISADYIGKIIGKNVGDLIENVMTLIAERIAAEVVSFISGKSLLRAPTYAKPDDLGLWLFEENLYQQHPFLGATISLKVPIIGIGAPAKIFLPRVAEILHTELITPENFQVANAVGAVSGSVIAIQEAWIIPQLSGMNVVGYYVQSGDERRRFSKDIEAISFAEKVAGEQAIEEALKAGTKNPLLTIEQLHDGAESKRIRTRAIGNPELG